MLARWWYPPVGCRRYFPGRCDDEAVLYIKGLVGKAILAARRLRVIV